MPSREVSPRSYKRSRSTSNHSSPQLTSNNASPPHHSVCSTNTLTCHFPQAKRHCTLADQDADPFQSSCDHSTIPAVLTQQPSQGPSAFPSTFWTSQPTFSRPTFTSDPSTSSQPAGKLLRAPLTFKNLKELDSETLGPSHQAASSMVSATSTATDPAEVWRQLNRNHIYKDNEKGEKLGAVLITQAKEIINNKRQSVMEDKELGDYKVFWNEYATAGETTFLINLCEVLLKKDRKKRNDLTDKDWVITAWKKDGLRVNWQEHFATEWVPQLDSHGDEWLAFLYENVPKVKTPWPDITYGYTRSSCDYIIDEAAHHFGAILVKEVLFPWLFDEAKGAGQPFAAASYQAARAGAAANHQLVEVFRRIHEEIAEYKKSHKQATSGSDTLSKKSYPYVDEDPLGMVFCLAVCPDVAELSVHFAEHHDDKSTYYHMHIIGAYAMKKGDDVRELRKHINNILDWGLTTRKEGLEKKFADFFEQVGLGKKRKGEEHSGGDEKAKSAKPGTG